MEVFLKPSASQEEEQPIPDLWRDGSDFTNPPGGSSGSSLCAASTELSETFPDWRR